MNSAAWNAWLATLPADRREEYGIVLERITKIVDEMRSYLLDQLQRVERRQDTISQRQADQASRLDTYEEQRARDVRLELTTRIAQVEELRGLTVRVQALELRMQERGGDAEQRR
jgi:hypothetical protein